MAWVASLASCVASRALATSERTRERSGSDEASSWSYPQVLIAVSTVNRVSLVSKATGL